MLGRCRSCRCRNVVPAPRSAKYRRHKMHKGVYVVDTRYLIATTALAAVSCFVSITLALLYLIKKIRWVVAMNNCMHFTLHHVSLSVNTLTLQLRDFNDWTTFIRRPWRCLSVFFGHMNNLLSWLTFFLLDRSLMVISEADRFEYVCAIWTPQAYM